jgi:hypothetical protein
MTETIPAPSGIGTVLLDIGADTGALILHAPAELNGVEIEISPNGSEGAPRIHSRVRERRVGAAVRHAAVYPGVPSGTYTVWRDAVTPVATVTITGGSVTSCRWPA